MAPMGPFFVLILLFSMIFFEVNLGSNQIPECADKEI